MEHYYTGKPGSTEKIQTYQWEKYGLTMSFQTNSGVFSKDRMDFGSELLIDTVVSHYSVKSPDTPKVLLDMGCGYGPMGIVLARMFPGLRVTMADVNERALDLAKSNARVNHVSSNIDIILSNGFDQIKDQYGTIITNPPIRAGKAVVYSFFEGAFSHLETGGEFFAVLQKKQGADSAKHKLTELFGNCLDVNRKAGYHIFLCKK